MEKTKLTLRIEKPVIESAKEQPALVSLIRILFSGHKTLVVSAIKYTPQTSIVLAVVFAASLAIPRESPFISEIQ